jgi:hypothetical protein
MAELKTKQTEESVEKFLKSIEDETRRKDSFAVAKLMEEVTGVKPKMWGPSIVGFGSYHYKYASGREGDMPIAAFSPRKQSLTLYIMPGLFDRHELMKKLGKHSVSKSCLYIKRLDDIHFPTLKKLVSESVKYMKKKYK